jgi:putative cell wall-binding protein
MNCSACTPTPDTLAAASRRRLCLALVLSLTAALLAASPPVLGASPAAASELDELDEGTPVWPGVERHEFDVGLADGATARVNVLSFTSFASDLRLRPVLGQSQVEGLESVASMNSRFLERAIGGINGGFWMPDPLGVPNGYFARDGELVSEPDSQGTIPRGTVGITPLGSLVFDRVSNELAVFTDSGVNEFVTGVNRYCCGAPAGADGDSPMYLYTDALGSVSVERQSETARVRTLVVESLTVRASRSSFDGEVVRAFDGPGDVAIPESTTVVVGHNDSADALEGVRVGDEVDIGHDLEPRNSDDPDEWDRITAGLAAGPLIVADGQITDPKSWQREGFPPRSHSNTRAPRSAVGQTGDGLIMLVTVDGRRPGYSAGMTMRELAELMVSLGAPDALSLDGGGSTQFAVDGLLRNRHCCDSAERPVSNGLFLFADYSFTDAERLAGAGRADTAAAAALDTYPDGATETVLASAGDYPDALAGGPLATSRDAPLLLTGQSSLPGATQRALDRLDPQRVTVLGGKAVVSEEVERVLERRGYTVAREGGSERTETAAEIADSLDDEHERIFLASAGGFADALSAAAPAGMLGAPILLSHQDKLPEATAEVIAESSTEEVVITGGAAAISPDVESQVARANPDATITRLAGQSRYGTARAINQWAAGQIDDLDRGGVVVALGSKFPDALAGGPLAASRRQLLMITPSNDINGAPASADFFADADKQGLDQATLLGGYAVLSSFQQWQLDQLARGGSG